MVIIPAVYIQILVFCEVCACMACVVCGGVQLGLCGGGQVPASVVPKMLVHQPHAKGHSFVQGKAVGKMVPEADFVRVQ